MGEHLFCTQGVKSSSLFISTIHGTAYRLCAVFLRSFLYGKMPEFSSSPFDIVVKKWYIFNNSIGLQGRV